MKTNIPILFASVLVSVALWLYVAMPDVETRQIKIRLTPFGLADKYVVTEMPVSLDVDVQGSVQEIQSLSNLIGEVGLQDGQIGRQPYDVYLPSSLRRLAIHQPYKVQVTIEDFTSKRLPISLEIGGSLADHDKVLQPPLPSRKEATISGAKSFVDRVVRIQGAVDQNSIDTEDPKEMPITLQALDAEGRPVSAERLERPETFVISPERVSIRPVLLPAPSEKLFVVSPTIEGITAPGYVVESVTAIPNQVSVRGPSNMLAQLRNLKTERIDVTGLKSTQRFSIGLRLPQAMQLVDGAKSISVEVKIRPVNANGSPPQ